MRNLLLACLLSPLGFLTAHAQGATPTPKAKDNLVLIQTPDSAATALKKLALAFVAQGYTVDKLDREFLTLTLAPKVLAIKHSPALTVHAQASKGTNSSLRLSGTYKGFIGSLPIEDIAKYEGVNWGLNSRTFHELQKAALAYPAGQVSYAKQ